jgi:bacillithiol biosynthesis cysteine-adding enzyme BshC
VRDLLEGSGAAGRFFAHDFRDPAAYRARADEIDRRMGGAPRDAWIDAVTAPGERARTRLDAVRSGNGYLVTTGQQPGLFGGPLYSLYKAITAARLADALEAALGVPVAPLFWTASEDHDWAEADHTWLIGVDNELHRLQLPTVEGAGTRPLHRLPMGSGVEPLLERCRELVPETDFAGGYLDLLRRRFTPAATLPDAFEGTLAELLEPLGLLYVQAHAPRLKELSRDLLLAELDAAEGHEASLAERAAALEAEGYPVQVPVLEGGINLFFEGPAGRERLYREGGGFRLRHSDARLERGELAERVAADSSLLSPNVLLRPVVESHVFPTLAYVAGPGETTYFAQLQPLFEAHGIGMPVVFPRLGATAVEGKVGKVLEKFGLEVDALSRPFHELAGDIARDEVPEPVRRALGELKGAVAKGTQALAEAARPVDPTLKGPIQHVRSVTLEALGEAEKKILQAVKRENEIALQQLEKARLHLFPEGKPQERALNPFYYLVRYGAAFVEGVADRFSAALPLLQARE